MRQIDQPTRDAAHVDPHAGGHSQDGTDPWHDHTAEAPAQQEHTAVINTGALVKWLVGIIVLVVLVIVGVAQFTYVTRDRMKAERIEMVMSADYLAHRERVDAELSAGGRERRWSALDSGMVQIPIEDAMDRVVQRSAAAPLRLELTTPDNRNPDQGGPGADRAPVPTPQGVPPVN